MTRGPAGTELPLGETIPPHVQAIILCDHIYRDDDSGKCVIAGTFNRVFLQEFPGYYQPASMYINLSDFSGIHTVGFRFKRLADEAILHQSPGDEIVHGDRREHHECIFELPPLPFPEPGRYTLEILFDGDDSIGHADVEAQLLPDPEAEPE